MSRFIKISKLKLIKYTILVLLLIFLITSLILKNFLFIVIALLGIIFIILNEIINKKIFLEAKKFKPFSNIRNIDYLIIGNMCDISSLIPKDSSYIAIMAPNRNTKTCFELLKHTYSILNIDEKKATAIIIDNPKNQNKEFTIFDIPFLSRTKIKDLNLSTLLIKSKFPLLFAPISSLKFLFNLKQSALKTVECPDENIKSFCDKRNIKLDYKILS